jgi:signal transduction histidine kinase
MAAAATGDLTQRVPLADDLDETDETVMLAVGLNTLLEDLTFSDARREAATKDLTVALKAKDDFIGIAGHELKTPLAALLMQLQIIQRTFTTDSPERTQARLERAVTAAWRMDKLIHQLLDVARIGSGKLELDARQVDLVPLVEAVAARFADAGEAAHKIALHVKQSPIEGTWDCDRLDQVVTNLVSNALKYGRSQPIGIHLFVEESQAVMRVTDSGIGMDQEQMARLFTQFERAPGVRQIAGLGLGLWITRQIVHASAGTIDVHSELGEGTTFTVRLPMAPPSGSQSTRPPSVRSRV